MPKEPKGKKHRRPRAWNSTLPVPLEGLKRSTPLRARDYRRKRKDGRARYGPLFEAVKAEPCWGRWHVPGHTCWGPHTAHHEPPVGSGGHDEAGMLPTCEALHMVLDQRALGMTRRDLLEGIGMTEGELQGLALDYVRRVT